MGTRIKFSRVGTAAQFQTANPVLGMAETGWESDTLRIKVGDGVTPWNSLGYAFENGGGGGVTDHGQLNGLNDDDHTQYLTESRHDNLPNDNPHGVTKNQVGLGNVPNTDFTIPVNANTQKVSFPEAPLDGQAYIRRNGTWEIFSGGAPSIFGQGAEDFINTQSLNITSSTLAVVRSFTTASKLAGRYRIQIEVQLEPNSTSSNFLFQLRINGNLIGLDIEDEGKDVGSDIKKVLVLKGYHNLAADGTFNIELWGARESGTLVLKGVTAEVWRVS